MFNIAVCSVADFPLGGVANILRELVHREGQLLQWTAKQLVIAACQVVVV